MSRLGVTLRTVWTWLRSGRSMPSPETIVYRNRFGVEFGQMRRDQVDAAMRGEAQRTP